MSAGFLNWKQLIRPFAEELNLYIEHEPDLVKVTQYYVNKKGRNRQSINQEILDKFAYTDQKKQSTTYIGSSPNL